MRKLIFAILVFATTGPPLAAQTTSSTNVTLAEVERRALERNPRVAQARLEIDVADFSIAESRTVYSPNVSVSFTQRSQTNPSTSQLAGGQGQVTNDTMNYGTGVSQRLPWGGASYSIDFNSNRSATSNVFSTFNPSFSSGLSMSLTQPLLNGFRFDAARAQIETADIDRTIADVQVREETASTLHTVRRAYWELVYTADALDTARGSEALARRNFEENKLRIQLGTLAAIDLIESEAEIASRHQATVQAEGAWRTAQVNLKQQIVKDTTDPIWATTLVPVERPSQGAIAIDVPAAVATALANRTDLDIARKQLKGTDISLKLANEQRKPNVDVVVNYAASGIGGTRILRGADVLGGSATGTIPGGYGDALSSLAALDFPTWSVGLNVAMPVGKRASDAAYARAIVEKRQRDLQIETLQLQIAADVTRSAEQVRNAEEQVQAAAASRQLAEKRLTAETARRDAGMSTTFLVLQAQRDLVAAQTSELRARLDYRTALADFDRVQTAP
jgi:outer membrane protein TolC